MLNIECWRRWGRWHTGRLNKKVARVRPQKEEPDVDQKPKMYFVDPEPKIVKRQVTRQKMNLVSTRNPKMCSVDPEPEIAQTRDASKNN